MMARLAPLVCGVMVTGCLSSEVLVTVRADGSGTFQHSTRFRPSGMAQFDALAPPDPGASPRPPFSPIAGEQIRLAVKNTSPYVQILSSRPVRDADAVGETAVFAFSDISKMDLDLLPTTPIPLRGFLPAIGVANTRLVFSLATNTAGNHVLTIRFPRFPLDPDAEPPGAWATGSPQDMAMLRQAFEGARVTIAVQGEAPLLRSNSPHRTENGVVVFDMRVDDALFSRQIDMLRAAPASFDELLTMIGDLPGVTLADAHVVTLEFQGAGAPLLQAQGGCHQPSPDTEIYLAPLRVSGPEVSVGPGVNITNSAGYDNQPSFTSDGRGVLFTSDRGARPTDPPVGQTDTYRYDIAARRVVQITRTPECEYSPTMTPAGRIAVVRVEADRTQRLWSVTPEGTEPALVFPDIQPVGYHAWMDEHTVALFVLGSGVTPSTLQVADTRTGRASIVASDIGRSLQRMPSGRVSFVQRAPRPGEGAPPVTLRQLFSAPNAGALSVGTSALTAPVPGSAEPYPVWLPDGTGLMAHADTLYVWRAGDLDWKAVADLAAAGLRNVSRLAVSPKGDWMAMVGAPK